jgi:hypothetical protein
MISEIGMVAGIGLLAFGAHLLEKSDRRQRKIDLDLHFALNEALMRGSCKCPRCGGTNWKTIYFPPHFFYAIDCARCGQNGGDSYTFAKNHGITAGLCDVQGKRA